MRSKQTEKGSAVLESKKGNDWTVRYAFYTEEMEWPELDHVKKVIHNSTKSAFNKALLIALVLEDGTLTINEERLLGRQANGDEQRILFHSSEDWTKYVGDYFSQSIHQAAIRYVKKRSSAEASLKRKRNE